MTDNIMTLSGGDVRAHMMRAKRHRTIALSFTKGIQSPIYLGAAELKDLRPWINEVLGKEPVTDDTLTDLLAEVQALGRVVTLYIDESMDHYERAYHQGHQEARESIIHLIEQAQAARPQPAVPKAKPWEPKDLATAPDNIADTIKGLTAEVDVALWRINALKVYMREQENRIDILMQNDARIEALESNVQETYRDTAQRLRTMEENWRFMLDARLGDIKRIENVERLFPTWKPLEPTALQMDAALRRIEALEAAIRELSR